MVERSALRCLKSRAKRAQYFLSFIYYPFSVFVCLHTKACAFRLVAALVELVVIAGQDGVQQDAGDGGDGQTGQVDVNAEHGEGDAADGVEAQRADQNDRRDDQVAACLLYTSP